MQFCGKQLQQPWYHKFVRRRLKVWQPTLTPAYIIPFYVVCGVVLLLLGIVLAVSATQVIEYEYNYTGTRTDDNNVGSFEINIREDMPSPLWIYYKLDGVLQNHRRHMKSYDVRQAHEQWPPRTVAAAYTRCDPATESGGRVLYPCGLVATQVFNDTFVLVRHNGKGSDGWERVPVDSDATTIAWAADVARSRNLDPEAIVEHGTGKTAQEVLDMWVLKTFPPVECEQQNFSDGQTLVPVTVALREQPVSGSSSGATIQVADCKGYMSGAPSCNFVRAGEPFECDGAYKKVRRASWGVESGHLLAWNRIAGLPSFRKLWGKVSEPLQAGAVLRVYFVDRFPAEEHHVEKSFVISTTALTGGQDDMLGYTFLFAGACCLIFATWQFLQCVFSPRSLGDISYLASQR